ncbi:DNA primase/helicase, phage-associated [Methanosarcina siciliae T4/M]|uniref:DNA primase/helicase, phage-associated n=1 Tax=Methanosarcina siciliae T4/M TaxID=1434120 RepID=A0A0E3P365_9EURY|nr:phage/plasmid primase, P4 family [Methanosarcina siciliae]AKB27939.1 DNA primase/helicase, phage-associated [Methanosarcina siciliae T4/M]
MITVVGMEAICHDSSLNRRRMDFTAIPSTYLNKSPERLIVNNGILDVLTGDLADHTPAEMYTMRINVNYDPDVEIPDTFEKYLTSTFKGVEWQIPIIQEMIGYCLYKKYFIEKFFFLVGNGSNGKSVMINLITRLLGQENISAMDIHEICYPKDIHSLKSLHGKLANLCGETGDADIKNLGKLKKVTGRDLIRSRDLYKSWIEFYNFAKIIVSMNNPPTIKDGIKGAKRRLVIITFPNEFNLGINADENLEDKLFTPESLTGVLNWALTGLHRLIENGKFSDPRTEAQITNRYEKISGPVKCFVEAHIDEIDRGYLNEKTGKIEYSDYGWKIVFEKSRLTFAEIYEAYVKYAKKQALPIPKQADIIKCVTDECIRLEYAYLITRDRYEKDEDGKPRPWYEYFKGLKLCGTESLDSDEITLFDEEPEKFDEEPENSATV